LPGQPGPRVGAARSPEPVDDAGQLAAQTPGVGGRQPGAGPGLHGAAVGPDELVEEHDLLPRGPGESGAVEVGAGPADQIVDPCGFEDAHHERLALGVLATVEAVDGPAAEQQRGQRRRRRLLPPDPVGVVEQPGPIRASDHQCRTS
jgi:hypothetical protein